MAIQSIVQDLLVMNREALAALVQLGVKAGDPLQFITNTTDRFIVASMIVRT